ncbi:hypothetical protein RIK65_07845 [Enterobacter asburiae]|uniref:hypothetical protein n=1 Tax=Enterobacter asburiae TaxID=61645 RepID=UPI00288C0650|nr:hypothetical protein [Enterobacter asburiae]WNI65546.1 hypothetical protein RIL73_19835 [Enterobacter asburiae]WNI69898.1 hypothetical protein RIK65_07845 [Enterobacter asburiae]
MAFFIWMLQVVDILHYISANGPLNHFALCAGRYRFLLTGGDDFLNLFVLRCLPFRDIQPARNSHSSGLLSAGNRDQRQIRQFQREYSRAAVIVMMALSCKTKLVILWVHAHKSSLQERLY